MGGDTSHPLATRAGQGGAPPPDDVTGKISRRTTARRAQIGLANMAEAATVGHQIFLFSGHSRSTYTSLPPFLDPLSSFPWSLFADFSHLKDTTKTNLADCWIKFYGHHSNLWTKVRVLLCSWSLGISVDIKFVNFGRRLVRFPFLGNYRKGLDGNWAQLVKLDKIEVELVKLDIFMSYWKVQFRKLASR